MAPAPPGGLLQQVALLVNRFPSGILFESSWSTSAAFSSSLSRAASSFSLSRTACKSCSDCLSRSRQGVAPGSRRPPARGVPRSRRVRRTDTPLLAQLNSPDHRGGHLGGTILEDLRQHLAVRPSRGLLGRGWKRRRKWLLPSRPPGWVTLSVEGIVGPLLPKGRTVSRSRDASLGDEPWIGDLRPGGERKSKGPGVEPGPRLPRRIGRRGVIPNTPRVGRALPLCGKFHPHPPTPVSHRSNATPAG